MKAIRLLGNGKAKMVDVAKPELPEGYAMIEVAAAGICGTDIEMLLNSPEPIGYIPGHEAVGTIVEMNGIKGFNIGDRVLLNCHITCGKCKYCKIEARIFCKDLQVIGFGIDGADAEYIAMPKENLTRIPDDISFDQALLLTDALGTPYNAVKRSGIKKGDKVGVTGVGPLGIMCVISARYFSADVIAIDLVPERLKQAKKFGALYTINPEKEDYKSLSDKFTDGEGLDIIIECSGSGKAVQMALELLKVRGKLIQVGVCTEVTLDLFKEVVAKELHIIGSRGFVDSEIKEIIDLIRKKPEISEAITHRYKLGQAQEAFDMAESKNGIKVIFEP